jgi:oligopeptide/dipeptide ABC transporter ATP-binding protein
MKDVIVRVQNLTKHFPIKIGFFKSLISKEIPVVRAVDGVSFNIRKKEIFGLVGESGSGKTTLARLILRLIEPTDGKIFFKGMDISTIPEKDMRKIRSKMQIIFQDPYESLNPRMSVYDIVAEPLELQKVINDQKKLKNRIVESLEDVGLTPPESFLYRFPHELSGGQRQRVAVARVFALRPELIVADEPVSMLDASVRGEVLKLMLSLVEKYDSTVMYITHDISLSRVICDRIAVMYLGKIVEMGTTEKIIKNPTNPYTKALLSAVLVPDPTVKRANSVVKGEISSPLNPASGCRFHPRCSYAMEECKKKEPKLIQVGKNHYVACHLVENKN